MRTDSPTAEQLLASEFLEIRSRLLDLAAHLDRIGRQGSPSNDQRWNLILRALEVLQQESTSRAEEIQMLFSRPYEADWKAQFEQTR